MCKPRQREADDPLKCRPQANVSEKAIWIAKAN